MTLMFEISCLSLLAVGGLMLHATFDLWSFHKGFVQGGEVLSIDTHVLKWTTYMYFLKFFLQQNRMMVQFVEFDFSYQKSLYEICVSTCDDWGDGHDLFPDKQFNMAGDRSVIYSSNVVFLFLCMCGSLDRRYIYSFSPLYSWSHAIIP